MTVQALIHDLLRWIPKSDRTGALREVLESRQELGDHESVESLAAVLRDLEAQRAMCKRKADQAEGRPTAAERLASSTTWTDGEGEG